MTKQDVIKLKLTCLIWFKNPTLFYFYYLYMTKQDVINLKLIGLIWFKKSDIVLFSVLIYDKTRCNEFKTYRSYMV